jgi:predicted signal transduction protein with EAL and GGDEF domain
VLLRSTVAMAHGLGPRVVAEGVQRTEDVALLRHLGCDLAQGYWVSPPRPAEEFEPGTQRWALPPAEATPLGWAAEPDGSDAHPAGPRRPVAVQAVRGSPTVR